MRRTAPEVLAVVEAGANRVRRLLDGAVNAFALTLLLLVVVAVFLGVVARYVFNSSFTWTEELGAWCLVWLTLAGLVAGHSVAQPIALNLFESNSTKEPGALRGLLIDLTVTYCTLMFLAGGVQLFETIGGHSTALGWPNALKYAVIPVACAVSLIYIILADGTLRGMMRGAAIVAFAIATAPPLQELLRGLATGISPSLVMGVIFAGTLLLGVPVALAMLFGAFVAIAGVDALPVSAIVHTAVSGSSSFVLLAIPFFLTVGYLMNSGGLSARVIDLADALVGHLRGGLAQANVVQSLLLGGVCGSASADAASTTKIMVPQMIKRGYSGAFSCAVTAVTSILPACFPPSIALLVYAAVAEVSVGQLFAAGIVPGFLLCGLMMLTVAIVARRRHYEPAHSRLSTVRIATAATRALPIVLLAVAIVVLLRFGVATATEIGALAILWVFCLGKFLYREMSWMEVYRALRESAVQGASIGFLIAASAPVAWLLIAEGVPKLLITWAANSLSEAWQLLLLLNVVMLVAGTVLELIPMILIVVPLFVPLLLAYQVDPVHVGIIVVINGLLGSITPPVGILVFISAQIAKVPAAAIFRECKPFLVAMLVGLTLITLIPGLSLTLWKWIG